MEVPDSKTYSTRQVGAALGCSHTLVRKMILDGRLSACVKDGAVIDLELAKQEWLTRVDRSEASTADLERAERLAEVVDIIPAEYAKGRNVLVPVPPRSVGELMPDSLTEAARNEKHWKSKEAELKFKQRAGELIEAARVKSGFAGAILACRTRLLGIPSRARQQIPHLTLPDIALLEDMVREALEELAGK